MPVRPGLFPSGRSSGVADLERADLDDASALRDLYCAKVSVGDDLLEHIHAQSKGVARRICVNLERVQQAGLELGKKSMDLTSWGKRPLYTGEAPVREGR